MAASPAPEDPSARRSRRWRLNVLTLIGARGLTVGCGLAQVAVALPYLGAERYGAWMLFFAVATAVHVCDFGVGVGTQQAMAQALARGQPEEARAVARSGVAWLGGMGVGLLAGGGPFVWWADWPAWCGLAAHAPEVRPAALGLLVFTALALPLNMAPRLAGAAQWHWLQAWWSAIGSAATLAWVAWAAATRGSFASLVTGAAVLALLQNTAMALHAVRRLRWGGAGWPVLAPAAAGALRRACGCYAVPQLGLALVQGAPAAALSLAGGPAAVTVFNLIQRLLTPFVQLQTLALAPLWPAYAEAVARGESAWVRRKFRQSLALAAGLWVVLPVVTSQAEAIIALWTRRTVTNLDTSLVWLSCAWFAMLAASQPLTALLIGAGRQRELARAALIGYPLATVGLWAGAVAGRPGLALALGSAALAATLLPLLAHQAKAGLAALDHPTHSPPACPSAASKLG